VTFDAARAQRLCAVASTPISEELVDRVRRANWHKPFGGVRSGRLSAVRYRHNVGRAYQMADLLGHSSIAITGDDTARAPVDGLADLLRIAGF
jgi:hypothetical protein